MTADLFTQPTSRQSPLRPISSPSAPSWRSPAVCARASPSSASAPATDRFIEPVRLAHPVRGGRRGRPPVDLIPPWSGLARNEAAPSARQGRFCMSERGSGPITSPLLQAQQFEEQADGVALLIETMLDHAALRSDSAPASHETGLSEQSLLNRKRIEAGHFPARVTAFDIEVVGLRDHARQIRKAWNLCPTTRLNRSDRIDSRR